MTTHETTPFQPGHYMTFKLGDELFAINVFKVREVLDMTPITKVPTAPPYLRGVVNVRGKAIPVVDLRQKFGLPSAPETVHTRIVVLEIEVDGEACVVGGQADSVHEVIELDASQAEPPPHFASRWRAAISQGLVRRGDEFIIVLDLDVVFGADAQLADVAAAA
jgi:purine-binding chemotaxis protein CheW